jgi:hypothetical protein
MNTIGKPERATRNRAIVPFRDELGYRFPIAAFDFFGSWMFDVECWMLDVRLCHSDFSVSAFSISAFTEESAGCPTRSGRPISSADWQSAVSQVGNLRVSPRGDAVGRVPPPADCQSAIQQIDNLRYGGLSSNPASDQ